MIVITQPNATEQQIQRIVTRVREFGLEAQISRGASRVIIGVIGPEALLREKPIAAMPGVELGIPRLEFLRRREIPAGVGHGDPHRVTRLDLDDRLDVGREVPVEIARLERELVKRH